MYYDEWLRLGERLGLSGGDLILFIKDKEEECIAREERAQRRDEERRQMQMNFELQMKERDLEIERLRVNRVNSTDTCKAYRPKIPKFDEEHDNIDAYLERFERYAQSQKWEEESWAISLSSLLTGMGLEVYTSMPQEEACNYDSLKKAILRRYQLTEDGFRSKFRQSKPDQGESVFQFVSRIKRYFSRWTELAGIEKTYESLCDLMIREQFIEGCSAELAVFLKERTPKSMDEITRLAEQYIEAHKGTPSILSKSVAPQRKHNSTSHEQSSRKTEEKNGLRKTCFICNKAGHLARDCRQNSRSNTPKSCFICNKAGHLARDCKQMRSAPAKNDQKLAAVCVQTEVKNSPLKNNTEDGKLKLASGESVPILAGVCTIDSLKGERNLEVQRGFVGTEEVKVLRDTGCESAAVRRDLVKEEQFLGKEIVMITIDGDAKVVPMAKIWVDTPYYIGEIEAMVPKSLICDLVIGNVPGVLDRPDPEWKKKIADTSVAAVMTRSQSRKAELPTKALNVPKPSCETEVNVETLKASQKEDKALQKLWDLAKTEDMLETKGGAKYKFAIRNGVLYRVYLQTKGAYDYETKQIVVPASKRKRVMELAHESIVGGHLSAKKTEDRITSSFYWPGISSEVGRFCRSCDKCQKTIPKGRVKKVPLGDMPVIKEPFHRIAINLIGPIAPVSDSGNRYILTVVDYATRYPEAVALPRIDTERVAEALLYIFSRVGLPGEVLSDRGSQFTSDLMKECNGFCERMNGVLKSMLKKMCQERPKDWDRYLSAVLFAYREVPQSSTGFSPFELLYGRTVRGPMQVLKEIWTAKENPETQNTYQYVFDLKQRLEETCKIARESLNRAQRTYKHHYDKKARKRVLKLGDKVLLLLPTDKNKMMLQWKGPYEVVEAINGVDYRINVGGAVDDESLLEFPGYTSGETFCDVKICERLTQEQRKQVLDLLQEFSEVFSEQPGTTPLIQHHVELIDQKPIRVKQYPIPYAKRQDVEDAIKKMLEADVIEQSVSEYNAPIVIVKKKDGSNRFCNDFRRLNSVTKFDTEPMASVDDILARLKDDKFLTKIDLCKGYWQIPVAESC
ncbi:uncharacterized protein LOC128548205 [Mercenaria mercenaria]|uniref:uncharacterized protein LOC128548205 n=1 Tax=Mercenaria mercenaria TaxID=6596 RepID=UPI00234F5603|nr:uncharacterized protein LOC128548205 [Mercenaria mercenaria]